MNPIMFSSVFFLFLSLLAVLAFAAADDSPMDPEQYPKMDCAPTSCGNVKNITYPFWVDQQQPSHCGFPAFKLRCKDQTPVLQISATDYQVREIFYENNSLVLNNSDFLAGSCPVPHSNLTFSLTPFHFSSANRVLVFLFHCSPESNLYRVGCDANDTFACWGDELGSSVDCERVIVPVVDYSHGVNVTNYESWIFRNGFLVEWSATDCTECRESKGQCGYSYLTDTFMCICPDRAHWRSCYANAGKGRRAPRTIIGVGSALGASFLLVCLTVALYLYKNTKVSNDKNIEEFLEKYGALAPKRYSYSKVKKITKAFQEKLGQGGFGTVFKGTLNNGHLVAVKILKDTQGDGEEFINEVASICGTSHVNVVSLLGFCCEGSKRALIYDFMCHGSLEKFLYSEKPKTTLEWENLYQIAIGIARGLEYLHRGCNTRIVHFDIKPHNILLDQDFCPKISDFGLAKLCQKKDSIISIAGARGTIGYIAPEVFSRNFGVVSSKSDVYSYGMMVLEIVGGRKNANASDNSSEEYFPHWIYEHLNKNGNLLAYGVTAASEEIIRKMTLVGLWCIQTMPQNRPPISKVIEMLEGSVNDLQIPPHRDLSSYPLGSVIASTSSAQDISLDDCSSLIHP